MDATWMTTRTGMTYHSFKADDTAICRKNIRRPEGVDSYTEAQVDARLAEAWGARVRGFRKCETCSEMETAFEARLASSMAPSTGEGDYLPPAEETKTHHYNALGGQRYIAGRGWVNHCRVCQAPEGSGDHFYNKETTVTIKDGPLTERQTDIIERVIEGKRHKEIASIVTYHLQRADDPEPVRFVGCHLGVVRQEVTNITQKMGAKTSAQAVAKYATAIAYRNAAAQVLSVRTPNPDNEVDEHVNHVLEGIAHLFQDWAAQRLPK